MQVKKFVSYVWFYVKWGHETVYKWLVTYGHSYASARKWASQLPNNKYALNMLYWFTSSFPDVSTTWMSSDPPEMESIQKWTLHNLVSYILFVYTKKSEVYEVSTLLSKIKEALQDKFTEIKSYKIIVKTKIIF